jgi:hypothetical protein
MAFMPEGMDPGFWNDACLLISPVSVGEWEVAKPERRRDFDPISSLMKLEIGYRWGL